MSFLSFVSSHFTNYPSSGLDIDTSSYQHPTSQSGNGVCMVVHGDFRGCRPIRCSSEFCGIRFISLLSICRLKWRQWWFSLTQILIKVSNWQLIKPGDPPPSLSAWETSICLDRILDMEGLKTPDVTSWWKFTYSSYSSKSARWKEVDYDY